MASITARIKVRIGDTAAWTGATQALANGEIGYDTEKHELKVGDGTSLWAALPLANDETVVFDHKYVADVTESTENGKIKVTKDGKDTEVAVHGLGSAAYTDTDDYATSVQGAKADSAVQSVTIAGTALTGSAGNVSIDAAALRTALSVYTTTETDDKIDEKIAAAITSEGLIKEIEVAGVSATVEGNKATITEDALRTALTDGEDQATALATQAFVNSSITANAARFITPSADGESQFESFEALQSGPDYYYEGQKLTSEQLTNNDYAIFKKSVEGGAKEQWRALYQKSGEDPGQWVEQYRIGSAFTNAQQQALDSGITKVKVSTYDGYDARITAVKTTADAAAPKANPTFTGSVTVPTPTKDTDAATKKYVDDAKTEITGQLEDYAPLNGPTFTGTVTVPETPQNDTDAASKGYVDTAIADADVSGKIIAEIAKLDVTDTAEDGQYVSAVSQTDGKIKVERTPLPAAPTIEGTSPIKVVTGAGKVTISYEGSAATSSEDESATTFVSEITTGTDGKVSYKINTLEQALAALGTIEIDGGTAEDLAGE